MRLNRAVALFRGDPEPLFPAFSAFVVEQRCSGEDGRFTVSLTGRHPWLIRRRATTAPGDTGGRPDPAEPPTGLPLAMPTSLEKDAESRLVFPLLNEPSQSVVQSAKAAAFADVHRGDGRALIPCANLFVSMTSRS